MNTPENQNPQSLPDLSQLQELGLTHEPKETDRIITFGQLRSGEITLEHGDLIQGLRSGRDIDELEKIAAAVANPSFAHYRTPEHTIVREPLSTLLRPKNSTPELRNGVALVLDHKGTSLFVTAELHSRGKKVGIAAANVSYWSGGNEVQSVKHPLTNVTRRIEKLQSTPDLATALAEVRAQSAEQAQKVAANGLRLVILAGLPGTSRR
jgi:hypothetical protein